MAAALKDFLIKNLAELAELSLDELLSARQNRLMSYGNYKE